MIVLVPAYEPDHRLLRLLVDLRHHEVVVVDDGSGPAYRPVFDRAAELGAEVLRFATNRGKGAALKAGFAHIGRTRPGHDVVCADSDGQHRPDDIDRVAGRLDACGEMVLGTRRFTGPVPARSRIGNATTRIAFLAATGTALTDTQTGLRGFPAHLLPWLTEVPGQRFEYELNQLLRAVRDGRPIEQIDIATIYLDENASSHFRPLVDSALVYAPLLAFAASSLLGFVVDTVLMLGLVALTGHVALAAVTARLVSATVNFTVNRRYVFGRHPGVDTDRWRAAGRYAALAAVLLVLNVLLLEALAALTGSVVAAKVVTELTLFTGSYLAQRLVVFRRADAPGQVRREAAPSCMRRVARSEVAQARPGGGRTAATSPTMRRTPR